MAGVGMHGIVWSQGRGQTRGVPCRKVCEGGWYFGMLGLSLVCLMLSGSPGWAQSVPTSPPGTPPSGVIDKDGDGGGLPFAPGQEGTPPGAGAVGRTGPSGPGGPAAPGAPSKPGASAEKGKEAAPEQKVTVAPPDMNLKVDPALDPSIPCQPLPLNAMVRLNFKDVPIDDLIKMMSCWTQKNFMLTQQFQGKTVTLLSPVPVTVAEAYRAFLSALRVHGMTVVQSGKYHRIVPDAQGKQEPLPLYEPGRTVPDDESIVTSMVKLKYVPASELVQVLNNFKGKTGDIVAYGEDTLIITDSALMIRQLMTFVKELDIPTDREKIWIRPVQYAEAGQLVEIINTVFSEDAAGGRGQAQQAVRANRGRPQQPANRGKPEPVAGGASSVTRDGGETIRVTKVMADERTNQLVIVCNSTTYMAVDQMLRRMDVPIPGEGGIHIYYLENADAEELASTLSTLASGAAGRAQPARGKAPAAKGAAGGSVAGLFEGEVKITSHKQTNSLIIEASLKDFNSLKKVIQMLDIRRRQVYVEAIIMEISSNRERKFGMSGSAGTTFDADGETVPLLMGLGGMGISGFDMQQLMKGGAAVGLQGPLVDVSTGSGSGLTGDLSIPTFGFLIQAIASNSDVNILSTPHILTLDNEEAEIQVGKQIPYQASTMGGLGGLSSLAGMAGLGGLGGSPAVGGLGGLGGLGGYGMGGLLGGMGMVQRIDVDLTLKITPHVNESNYVRLQIQQSIEDVESIDRELGPTTSKRKVTNTVVVKDQQPVVIGGLIRDTESEGVDKVPFLGDIPLVGVFFRKSVTKTEKKNLLMIIIPHIIDDPSDLERIHRERTEEIRRFADYLATKELEAKGIVDYRKKTGGLEAMNQVVGRARDAREARERAEFEGTALDLVGPPESHELEYDPTNTDK